MDSKEQRSALRAAVYRRDGPAVVHLLRGLGAYDDSLRRAQRARSPLDVYRVLAPALCDNEREGSHDTYGNRRRPLGFRLLREGLERAGGLQLDIRTRTEGYYDRFGASRSLGFRLTREHVGLRATADSSVASVQLRVESGQAAVPNRQPSSVSAATATRLLLRACDSP